MSKKILVVEDHPDVAKLLEVRLKSNHYTVISAKDGLEGVEKVSSDSPDLVITDLAMPKLTGNILVRIIKKSEKHKHIPIIMLSAFVQPWMKDGVEIPADAYVPKPFNHEELLGKIKELLKE